MKRNKTVFAAFALSIFYLVGIVGISLPGYKEQVLALSPLNLLLTFALFLYANDSFTLKQYLALGLVYCFGFGIEVFGVKTGIVFGEYFYGESLGLKLFEVPLIIGVNWLLLTLCTYSMFDSFLERKWIITLCAASTMTVLDFMIEPVAIRIDFWHWEKDIIPIQNYIAWFIFSLLFVLLLSCFKLRINWRMSLIIIGLQFLFFGVLNLLLHQ